MTRTELPVIESGFSFMADTGRISNKAEYPSTAYMVPLEVLR